MIPASHWYANDDDGTAWWVPQYATPTDDDVLISKLRAEDRPCDTCGGSGGVDLTDSMTLYGVPGGYDYATRCPDCRIFTGRHSFDLWIDDGTKVPADPDCVTKVHASVVPGAVLPIFDRCPDYKPADHICATHSHHWWIWHRSDNDDWTEMQIQLPSAAAPGMWAVGVRVA